MEVSEISHRIISDLLMSRTGQQITESRRWRVDSALAGVYREHGISNLDQLVCLLADEDSASLTQEVVEALLNNESYFFRDRAMFDLLSREVLPDLAKKRSETKRLSIWSAGCSTGQEALSLAMIFANQPEIWGDWTIDIVGTDISERAIKAARRGCYSQFEIQRGLGVQQMLSNFHETPDGWVPNEELRQMVWFNVRNLLDPAQIPERFDLVLCRNVLLYFDATRRAQALARVGEAMRADGWLMLGAGEAVTTANTDTFQAVEGSQGMFALSGRGKSGHVPAQAPVGSAYEEVQRLARR